jgi:hypothetical protein
VDSHVAGGGEEMIGELARHWGIERVGESETVGESHVVFFLFSWLRCAVD